jgi:hypothetical protein
MLMGKGDSAEGSIGSQTSRASIRASIHTRQWWIIKQACLSCVVAVMAPMT